MGSSCSWSLFVSSFLARHTWQFKLSSRHRNERTAPDYAPFFHLTYWPLLHRGISTVLRNEQRRESFENVTRVVPLFPSSLHISSLIEEKTGRFRSSHFGLEIISSETKQFGREYKLIIQNCLYVIVSRFLRTSNIAVSSKKDTSSDTVKVASYNRDFRTSFPPRARRSFVPILFPIDRSIRYEGKTSDLVARLD